MAVVFMTAWPVTTDAVDAVRKFGGVDYWKNRSTKTA
jgi:hypothetical protein